MTSGDSEGGSSSSQAHRKHSTSIDSNDNGAILVNVGIFDSGSVSTTISSSTILQAYPETVAAEFCDAIASKIDLTPEDAKFHTLIMVHTRLYDSNSAKYHCVRTLRPTEVVVDVLAAVTNKQALKYSREGPLNREYTRWFFKDVRTTPLQFGDNGEFSGESTSEDEEDLPLSDLTYLRQGERRGYLLRRSVTDPNLWRKRYCILTDKLWSVDIRDKVRPKAKRLLISGSTKVTSKTRSLDYPHSVVLFDNSSTHYFRASSASEQQMWIEDLYQKSVLNRDSDAIKMAEMIICDEEYVKAEKLQKGLQKLLHHPVVVRRLRSALGSSAGGSSSALSLQDSMAAHPQSRRHPLPAGCLGCRVHNSAAGQESMVHAFHLHMPQVAAAVSFINAVNRYKELFRHDLLLSARQHWVEAVRLHNQHLLPVLHRLGFLKEPPTSDGDNDEWLRDVSMQSLTKVHEAIFSNVRRNSKSGTATSSGQGARSSLVSKRPPAGGSAVTKQSNISNQNSTGQGNGSFWGSIFKGGGGADLGGVGGPHLHAEGDGYDEYDYINYKLLDSSVRPCPTLFDEVVAEVEARCAAIADADF